MRVSYRNETMLTNNSFLPFIETRQRSSIIYTFMYYRTMNERNYTGCKYRLGYL